MSRDFNNADPDKITISGLLGEPAAVSVSVWVDVDAVDAATNGAEVFHLGDTVVIRTWDDTVRVHHYDGSYHELSGGGDLRGAGWVHLAYVVDPGNSRQEYYKDGSSRSTGTQSGALSYTLNDGTTIGAHDSSANFDLDGRIAEVGVWDRGLSDDEVAALAGGFSPLCFPDGLLACLPLVRGVYDALGNTVTDSGTAAADHPPGIIYPSNPIISFTPSAAPGVNLTAAIYHQRFHNLAA